MPRLIAGPDTTGKNCPFCQTPIKPGESVFACDACQIPHHAQCWAANGGCTTFGCTAAARPASAPSPMPGQSAGLPPYDEPGRYAPPPSYPPYAAPGDPRMPPAPRTAYRPMSGNPYGQVPYGYTGNTAPDLGSWNWGAFVFTWIWGINHRAYWTLLSLIPCFFPWWNLICAVMGNRWAWESRRFRTVEEMRTCENVWSAWGIVFIAVFLLLFLARAIGEAKPPAW